MITKELTYTLTVFFAVDVVTYVFGAIFETIRAVPMSLSMVIFTLVRVTVR